MSAASVTFVELSFKVPDFISSVLPKIRKCAIVCLIRCMITVLGFTTILVVSQNHCKFRWGQLGLATIHKHLGVDVDIEPRYPPVDLKRFFLFK